MKYTFMIALILGVFTLPAIAHEGDEEVSVKNNPRYGGRVAAVVQEEDHRYINKPLPGTKKEPGHKEHDDHDDAKYMSEILVSDENKVRLYFYNNEMKDIDLAGFPDEITIQVQLPGMESRGPRFSLKKSGKVFVGDLPLIKKKPYDFNVDFHVKSDSLHITFKAMD